MLQTTNEGPSHTSEGHQPTDEEEVEHTNEGSQLTIEDRLRAEENSPQSEHEGHYKTEEVLQSTDDRTNQKKEHHQPTDEGGIKEKDRYSLPKLIEHYTSSVSIQSTPHINLGICLTPFLSDDIVSHGFMLAC